MTIAKKKKKKVLIRFAKILNPFEVFVLGEYFAKSSSNLFIKRENHLRTWQHFLFNKVLNSLRGCEQWDANKNLINFSPFYFTILFVMHSVKTEILDKGANSSLLIAKINKLDSGNYSCFINATHEYTVSVHVLNGKPIRFQMQHLPSLFSICFWSTHAYGFLCDFFFSPSFSSIFFLSLSFSFVYSTHSLHFASSRV